MGANLFAREKIVQRSEAETLYKTGRTSIIEKRGGFDRYTLGKSYLTHYPADPIRKAAVDETAL